MGGLPAIFATAAMLKLVPFEFDPAERRNLGADEELEKEELLGSDTGIVLRSGAKKGRLVMACRGGSKGEIKDGKQTFIAHNCAMYSDDHGKTWTAKPSRISNEARGNLKTPVYPGAFPDRNRPLVGSLTISNSSTPSVRAIQPSRKMAS